ncbi:hypothetical protein [Micromonospora narathiwatensis]|uniref:FtsX extracellular domain-containing protein n=1 Tax=Micromonospora narathiwatensis TaxID=299146 RepID=A0A1A9A6E6_9ACTN|nr:hypothetical protein [Micromonospora narathiwatensis]SBT51693.1 hypothetical protein GA0070621_4153 [Micromonospora narathiwatensis]
MSHIREALVDLEQDLTGLRLAPPAQIRARGRARTRRRAAVLVGATAVAVGGSAALLPGLAGPAVTARPGATGGATGTAAGPAGTGTPSPDPCGWGTEAPATVRIVLRRDSTPAQLDVLVGTLRELRHTAQIKCNWGETVSTRPDRTGQYTYGWLLARSEDPVRIKQAVENLPGVERVLLPGEG